jgi:hypothetical protein
MKNLMKHPSWLSVPVFASVAFLFGIVLMMGSCGDEIDDWNSKRACESYCDKAFACGDIVPTDDQKSTCVSNCRTDIEVRCGNEHQAAANDKIFECVELACPDFLGCMIFEANPVCYGFVGHQ